MLLPKKNYLKPILIALIAVFSAFVLYKNLNQTASYDPLMFALKNPEAITEFRFTPNNKKAPALFFQKRNQKWYVYNHSDTFLADTSNINMLLFWAMKKLKVQRPVSETYIKNLSRDMALTATKATFSVNGTDVHSLFIGNPTQDNMATHMYMNNLKQPYVVEIPGFQGYLSPYFNTDIHIWRSLKLVDINPSDIQSLEVTWTKDPQQSFTVIQADNQIQLFNSQKTEVKANRSLIAGYLLLCAELSREAGGIAGINKVQAEKDSVLKQAPLVSFKYVHSKNKTLVLNIYPHQGFEDILIDSNPQQTETVQTALYWVKTSQDPFLWLSQDILLKNRLKRLSDFKM